MLRAWGFEKVGYPANRIILARSLFCFIMKKLGIGLLVVLLLLLGIYALYPARGPVTKSVVVEASQDAVFRCLTNGRLLQQWWQGDTGAVAPGQSRTVADNGLRFHFSPNAFDVVVVRIEGAAVPVQSYILVLPTGRDSVMVTWKATPDSNISKIKRYFLAQKLERSLSGALARLQQFAQSEANIYGMTIGRELVTDTILMVTKQRDSVMPQPQTYYGLIKKLRDYIAAQGAQETNYPMLHIATGNGWYQTMVAIPVNKPLPGNGAIESKRMVPGNILVAEVQGGPARVEEGLNQLEFYASEHRLAAPALPFQSLRTDRLAEPDTGKWITRLYYPIR